MVITLELSLSSYKVEAYDEHQNSEDLRVNLNLFKKTREKAQIQMTMNRWRAAHFFDLKVKKKQFQPGDLVLRKAAISQSIEQ